MEKLGYNDVMKDDVHLASFLKAMHRFDSYFCDLMGSGMDFTLRIEVRGDKGKLLHCRVHNDSFDRPTDKCEDH